MAGIQLARAHRARVAALASVLMVPLLAAAALPVQAAKATPYKINLVKNPSFEAGPASPDGNTTVLIPSWGVFGTATVVAYGTVGGFPTMAEGRRIKGKAKFFTAGPGPSCGQAFQTITIVGRDTQIDTGHVAVVVRASLGTYDQQTDTADLQFALMPADSGEDPLFFTHLTKTHTSEQLQPVSLTTILPPGTRKIDILLQAENVGGYCDAYFDKINVKLVKL